MKCDLHVHTIHSGMCTVPFLRRICRECYNDPREVYEVVKRRGMDLVTVTDHDSIDASEDLRRYPDFFLSEEVSCSTPSGTQLHLAVYDISECQHLAMQRRRDDLPALLAYLNEEKLFFAITHVFSSLTGRRTPHDFALFERHFPAVEVRNGQMLASSNRAAGRLARRWRKVPVAGSDSHTLHSLAAAYTEVPGASSRAEFLSGLRQGWSQAHGASGTYWNLSRAVLEIGCAMFRERPWTALLWPLAGAVPLITLANALMEYAFARKWAGRLELEPSRDERIESLVGFIRA